ncbi:MAG: hypothetical protein U9Q77_05330 [Candidatus Marinimicrobia bacterium]|nr:hypothetical protein [Candidatus Neomarinimicrobiota bacterium]
MDNKAIIKWLLEGDVSIQYQVNRDLLSADKKDLQNRISAEGWGKQFLSKRNPDGHWGLKFYQPKWISTHYTLLDLRNLCIHPENTLIKQSIRIILDNEKGPDGGIRPIGAKQKCDVCINGMFLNYAAYFGAEENLLQSVVDFILKERMPDGGFNCNLNTVGATHSSLHTTLSVLEGIYEYESNGYSYRLAELKEAERSSRAFILVHQLFLSDRTGEVIQKSFLKLPYPSRWKYDILKALDYFQHSGFQWDDRIKPAIEILIKKRKTDNRWPLQAKHPGQVHFEMEPAGKSSRWNTLRALRVLKHFKIENNDR